MIDRGDPLRGDADTLHAGDPVWRAVQRDGATVTNRREAVR
jgi:hypothetical protein